MPDAVNTGATSRASPSRYWVSRWAVAGSSGNSSAIGRSIGTPSLTSAATRVRYGISDIFNRTNRRATSTASSSNAHGTR